MSYDIVRSIKLDDENKRVTITAAANNVTPRDYYPHDSQYFADIWEKKGKQAVEIELVKAFESGNFQGGNSKYKEASERLRKMSAYKEFNWRTGGLGDEYRKISENRQERTAEFDALVLKALQAKKPKTKFVITKNYFGTQVYFYHRANAHFCRWYENKNKAKVFNYAEDAENMKRGFQNSDDWEVLQIA